MSAEFASETKPCSARRNLRPPLRLSWIVITSLMALFILGSMFRAGIDRGWDQKIPQEAYGRIVQAIAAVLTQLRSGEHGYALSNTISSELFIRGLTLYPPFLEISGAKAPDNLQSATFIDGVLDRMWRDVWTMRFDDVRGMGADDIGIIDYTDLSFWLFGHHIRSLYYMFFIILASTLFVALVEQRRNPAGQILIVAVLGLLYAICFLSNVFENEPSGLGGVTNPRFLSTLSIIPGLHIVLMLAGRAPFGLARAAAAAYQGAIIFFAMHIRSTAEWVPAGLALVALAGTAFAWRQLRQGSLPSRVAAAVGFQWPALIVLCAVAVGGMAVKASLNETYKRDGWLTQHAFWHSVYYSFLYNPGYYPYYDDLHDHRTGDDMPIAGISIYLKAHPERDTPDIHWPGSKSINYVGMERLLRAAFFSFILEHPRFAFDTFFIYKPRFFIDAVISMYQSEWHRIKTASAIIFVIMIITLGYFIGMSSDIGAFDRAFALLLIMMIPCIAIPFLTLVDHTVITEQVLAIQIAAVLLIALVLGHMVRIVGALFVSGSSRTGSKGAAMAPDTSLAVPTQDRCSHLS